MLSQIYTQDGNRWKIFLTEFYQPATPDCAAYYLWCTIDPQRLVLTDTVVVHYLNGKVRARGRMVNSHLHGYFATYYPNGKLEADGHYLNGDQAGVWTYYYRSGQLKKVLHFGDGSEDPLLKNFYSSRGKVMVINGEGTFKDEVFHAGAAPVQIRHEGEIANGRRHGVWKSYSDYGIIAKEELSLGEFLGGRSYSPELGSSPYYLESFTRVHDYNLLEGLRLWSNILCDDAEMVHLGVDFYKHLYAGLQGTPQQYPNTWYFVEVQFEDDEVGKVNLMPENPALATRMQSVIADYDQKPAEARRGRSGSKLFMLYLKGDVIFSGVSDYDNEILRPTY